MTTPKLVHAVNLHYTLLFFRSASTESVAGPVKNPWKYKFKKYKSLDQGQIPLDQGQIPNSKNSSLAGQSSLMDQSEEEDDDWFLAGGSSGGSVVSVATGVCSA